MEKESILYYRADQIIKTNLDLTLLNRLEQLLFFLVLHSTKTLFFTHSIYFIIIGISNADILFSMQSLVFIIR